MQAPPCYFFSSRQVFPSMQVFFKGQRMLLNWLYHQKAKLAWLVDCHQITCVLALIFRPCSRIMDLLLCNSSWWDALHCSSQRKAPSTHTSATSQEGAATALTEEQNLLRAGYRTEPFRDTSRGTPGLLYLVGLQAWASNGGAQALPAWDSAVHAHNNCWGLGIGEQNTTTCGDLVTF